eukprot:TRINITY_DN7714_c0_g1_i1.p1 TRINITY_DN7714_c0_g1~~TRINITY_DN7714_c0_g1_i1.p1  ORF type:complete len:428 (+),score=63.99 TRINITY_DN7714_c0_g1_i1:76-1359(+)
MEDEPILSWASLPLEPIIRVFSFLTAKDLFRVGQVSHYWNEVSSSDEVWKQLFLEQWVNLSSDEVKQSESRLGKQNGGIKQLYSANQQRWGRYVACYPRIRKLWNRLDAWYQTHAPHTYETLRNGATEEDIDYLEKKLNIKLSEEMRCSLRIRDGQTRSSRGPRYGMFGGYQFYNHHENIALNTVKQMTAFPKGNIPISWVNWCIPIGATTSGGKYFMVVDDDVSGEFKKGMILEPSGTYNTGFLVASSYVELLEDLANKLEGGHYDVSNEGEIIRFDSKSPYVETTKGVRVQASPLFIAEQSDPQAQVFTFAYRIRITMAADMSATDKCQLLGRHWIIKKSADAAAEEVQGPGVIGLYPVVEPGSFFEYASCCPINSTSGSMTGTFQMEHKSTARHFDVSVPTFYFSVPTQIRDAQASRPRQLLLM